MNFAPVWFRHFLLRKSVLRFFHQIIENRLYRRYASMPVCQYPSISRRFDEWKWVITTAPVCFRYSVSKKPALRFFLPDHRKQTCRRYAVSPARGQVRFRPFNAGWARDTTRLVTCLQKPYLGFFLLRSSGINWFQVLFFGRTPARRATLYRSAFDILCAKIPFQGFLLTIHRKQTSSPVSSRFGARKCEVRR